MVPRESCDFPGRVYLVRHKSKMTGDCCIFKFCWHSVSAKLLMLLQSETSVLKFLWHSMIHA